ncbi:ATP-binding protein [Candidatus Gracilibacteria bacterium]|nr:ATP-binding protein [Candidatus Gracilibacteria bacterium]
MYIQRFIEKDIIKYIDAKEYIAIIGPRQVGKTTFVKHLMAIYKNSFYYNFEDFSIKNDFEKNPIGFIKNHINSTQKNILFFDEFQYVKDAGNLLKLIFDTFEDKIKIIITGSSSLHLKEIGAKMTGRMFSFDMYGLSLDEILLHKNSSYLNSKNIINSKFDFLNVSIDDKDFLDFRDISFVNHIKNIVDEYIIWGGKPVIIKSDSIQDKNIALSNFTQNYINKDIVNLLKVRNIDKFSNLMVSLSILIGQQIVNENLSNDLGINIVTLNEYLNYLNNTFINKLINPYHKNSLNELKKQKIEYFYDLGIRNYLIKNFNNLDIRIDNGHLLENYIFLRLEERKQEYISLNYWREKSGNEVDFVIKMHNKIIPIEVKYQNFKKGEITTGMKKFNDLYEKEIKYNIVITKDLLDIGNINNKKIYFIPYYLF